MERHTLTDLTAPVFSEGHAIGCGSTAAEAVLILIARVACA
jgi:hypothetical protein